MQFKSIALAALAVAAFTQSATAATIWDEGIDGDLSGDQSAPTVLVVDVGSTRSRVSRRQATSTSSRSRCRMARTWHRSF